MDILGALRSVVYPLPVDHVAISAVKPGRVEPYGNNPDYHRSVMTVRVTAFRDQMPAGARDGARQSLLNAVQSAEFLVALRGAMQEGIVQQESAEQSSGETQAAPEVQIQAIWD